MIKGGEENEEISAKVEKEKRMGGRGKRKGEMRRTKDMKKERTEEGKGHG